MHLLAAIVMASLVPVADPPPGDVTIDVVTVNPGGCPVAVGVAPDNTSFTVAYQDLRADAGARRTCRVNLRVHAHGYVYTLTKATHHGFAHLTPGATASARVRYQRPGLSPLPGRPHRITGPHSDDWHYVDASDVPAFPPCGTVGSLTIDVELRVDAGGADPGSFIAFPADGETGSTHDFAWKRCP